MGITNIAHGSLMQEKVFRAIFQLDIAVFYQPRYSAISGEMISAEALVRWTGEECYAPDVFIPQIEKTPAIKALTEFVIGRVCHDIGILRDAGKSLPISINITPLLLEDFSFSDFLIKMFKFYGISPSMIEFELTETAPVNDLDRVIDSCANLRSVGFGLALDDFGMGYAGLLYLDLLPVTTIKVDRHFVKGLHREGARFVAPHIISMSKNMGMTSVAEGIETLRQLVDLVNLGCDELQGFLLARPMPLHELIMYEHPASIIHQIQVLQGTSPQLHIRDPINS